MTDQYPEAPVDQAGTGNEQSEGLQETDVPQAPEAVEPQAVEVSPEPTPGAKADNILGKDYEVTSDRGYRAK